MPHAQRIDRGSAGTKRLVDALPGETGHLERGKESLLRKGDSERKGGEAFRRAGMEPFPPDRTRDPSHGIRAKLSMRPYYNILRH